MSRNGFCLQLVAVGPAVLQGRVLLRVLHGHSGRRGAVAGLRGVSPAPLMPMVPVLAAASVAGPEAPAVPNGVVLTHKQEATLRGETCKEQTA